MKNTFMDGIKENDHGPEAWYPHIRKLRQDFHELISGKVSETDVVAYVHRLMEQPRYYGSDKKLLLWAMGEPNEMPSDAREEFIYQPTYLATAIIVYAIQHYDTVRNIPDIFRLLHYALNGCLGRGFGGHGYDYVEGLIDTMSIFADCDMGAFLNAHPKLNKEFTNAFEETVKYIEDELCTGKERNQWNNASYEDAAAPLLKRLKSSLLNHYLFVYGTLMRNGSAEDKLAGCPFLGKAILKDYAMYKIIDYPGIIAKPGEWVEGELYRIHDDDFARLDHYEREGELFQREILTVESSTGPQKVWVYVYLDKPQGDVMREPWINDKEDIVWYAGYGSNLSEERFLCYIKSGYCIENGKWYDGCSNPTLVSEKDDRAWFPGQMYFGNTSGSWNNKGVAFYDPNAAGRTFMRMYKVTREQLMEIQDKEGLSANWYGRIYALGIHTDGTPIYTMTSEARHSFNAPDNTYQNLILKALVEENGFTETEANLYLSQCLHN